MEMDSAKVVVAVREIRVRNMSLDEFHFCLVWLLELRKSIKECWNMVRGVIRLDWKFLAMENLYFGNRKVPFVKQNIFSTGKSLFLQ